MYLRKNLLVAVLALASSAWGAPQQQEMVHPLTNMPFASEDIETSYYLPEHEDKKLPIGQVVTALCHFSNTGTAPYNITAIMGSLNSPFNFDFYIQNYSYKIFGVVVNPGEEVSLDYQFQLHPNLEPSEYVVAHTVFYENERRQPYSSTFFNETVELYFDSNDFGLDSMLQLIGGVIFTIGTIVVAFYACTLDQRSSIKVFNNGSAGSGYGLPVKRISSIEIDDDWTRDHIDVNPKGKSSAGNKKKEGTKED
jgi:hypothetical protein